MFVIELVYLIKSSTTLLGQRTIPNNFTLNRFLLNEMYCLNTSLPFHNVKLSPMHKLFVGLVRLLNLSFNVMIIGFIFTS